MPAKQVQVLVEAWYTHSRRVWSLFMCTTVVVTVTTTQSRAERRQKQPQTLTRTLFRLLVFENIITISPVSVI